MPITGLHTATKETDCNANHWATQGHQGDRLSRQSLGYTRPPRRQTVTSITRPHGHQGDRLSRQSLGSVLLTLSVCVSKQILPDVCRDTTKRAHDHRQFLTCDPRLFRQLVHACHPALVILSTDQQY